MATTAKKASPTKSKRNSDKSLPNGAEKWVTRDTATGTIIGQKSNSQPSKADHVAKGNAYLQKAWQGIYESNHSNGKKR